MTPPEKTREIACHNCCCSFEDKSKANCRHYNNVWQMHEWDKEYYNKLLDLLVESGADADIITNYIKNCIEL